MSVLTSPKFLRYVLWTDAGSSAAASLMHLTAAGALAELLGLPATLLMGSGLLLLVYMALAGYLASCDPVPRPLGWVLVVGNWAWAAVCLVLLLEGALAPTLLGKAYLVVQVVAPAFLGSLQWAGLRRTPVVGWA